MNRYTWRGRIKKWARTPNEAGLVVIGCFAAVVFFVVLAQLGFWLKGCGQ